MYVSTKIMRQFDAAGMDKTLEAMDTLTQVPLQGTAPVSERLQLYDVTAFACHRKWFLCVEELSVPTTRVFRTLQAIEDARPLLHRAIELADQVPVRSSLAQQTSRMPHANQALAICCTTSGMHVRYTAHCNTDAPASLRMHLHAQPFPCLCAGDTSATRRRRSVKQKVRNLASLDSKDAC